MTNLKIMSRVIASGTRGYRTFLRALIEVSGRQFDDTPLAYRIAEEYEPRELIGAIEVASYWLKEGILEPGKSEVARFPKLAERLTKIARAARKGYGLPVTGGGVPHGTVGQPKENNE